MEMFYFTLGFLTIFALIIIGVLIVGMIKLYKLSKEVQDEKNNWRRDVENLYRHTDEKSRDWRESVDSIYRELERRFEECISYTDKRVDKTLNQKKEK